MHYHFMGIGGISMSGLAQILLEGGQTVSGCDLSASRLTGKLEARGVLVELGHNPEHVKQGLDVLVTSTAVPADHPEVVAARGAGKRVIRRIELLGELMAGFDSVGVVGTHGKTTTTSMIAAVFLAAGLEPTAMVGGEVADLGGNAKRGKGKHFIAEVDESDTYFQNLSPRTAVVTNAEDDHVAERGETRNNYHVSVAALLSAFRKFAMNADVVVYCQDWPGLADLVAGARELVPYGTSLEAEYRATDISLDGGASSYTLVVRGEARGQVRLRMPGQHNVLNSLAAVAVADRAGIGFETVASALYHFRGVQRRWQRVGEVAGAWVVDDYAHNPTKVAAALAGARSTGRRVRVVFQPHRYLRTAQVWERYAEALMAADDVLLLDVYGAGEEAIEGVHSGKIAAKMLADGHRSVRYYADPEAAVLRLLETAAPGEVIVTMGAGNVWKVGAALVERGRVPDTRVPDTRVPDANPDVDASPGVSRT